MTDDSELAGLDPFLFLDLEAARIERHLSHLSGDAWDRPSRCKGWSIKDVLAHLASSETYHQACLDGEVKAWIARQADRGGTDLARINAIGVADRADEPPERLLAEWRELDASTRRRFRDGADEVDTSVGPYPRRWQAFHVAGELATHADDVFAVGDPDEDTERGRWRARFSRFALAEEKPDLAIEVHRGGRTLIRGRGVAVDLDDGELIEGVAGRLGDSSRLDREARAVLSTMP